MPKYSFKTFSNSSEISRENSKPFWNFPLGRATEVYLPSKDEDQGTLGREEKERQRDDNELAISVDM